MGSEKKQPKLEKAPIQSISANAPMELLGLDFLHFDPCGGWYEYLLVITDHFQSLRRQVYPTANKKAKTAAERLYSDFMLKFGLPDKISHDQSGEFENDPFKEIAKLCGVKRIRTTKYHPQTNGKVERMSQTIISMLQILPKLHKRKWTDHVKKLVFACNYTKHPRTGYSPYFLLFGRPLKLSIDVILPKDCNVKGTYKDCINKWKEQVKESHKMVSKQGKKKDIQHRETVLQGFH